ncbi:RadC family protein [Aliidiomarina quisquiliarum]|uniref:RadC family protein n=1 Tax=Aliidiomarina quisquiliarum TaxID=2938947 RepID=UPI00208FEFF6|nr:DNA repair protein RadC [Aliidiomarina quisquiliarum]MCO4320016.1 DNA repair protein RadC [Aliidiomarina quisquiliarum]
MKLHNLIKSTEGTYNVLRTNVSEEDILKMARSITASKMRKGAKFTRPDAVKDYLLSHHREDEREKFGVILLDSQHRVISKEIVFEGTINAAPVYPREVVKLVLAQNAAALIIFHNHPSGVNEPSMADKRVTERLKEALSTIDVPLLDHFIVGADSVMSFAERGLI